MIITWQDYKPSLKWPQRAPCHFFVGVSVTDRADNILSWVTDSGHGRRESRERKAKCTLQQPFQLGRGWLLISRSQAYTGFKHEHCILSRFQSVEQTSWYQLECQRLGESICFGVWCSICGRHCCGWQRCRKRKPRRNSAPFYIWQCMRSKSYQESQLMASILIISAFALPSQLSVLWAKTRLQVKLKVFTNQRQHICEPWWKIISFFLDFAFGDTR